MTLLLILIGLTVLIAVYRATHIREDLLVEPGQLVRVIQYRPPLGGWSLWTRWPRLEKRLLTSLEGRVTYIDELGRFELELSDGGSIILDTHDPSLSIIPLEAAPAKAKRKRDLNR